MVKRILFSTAMLLALATTCWADGSGCSLCDAMSGGSGEYIEGGAYTVDAGVYSDENVGCGCSSGCGSVGESYFSNASCGCGDNYKYTRLFAGLGYVDDVDLGAPFTADFDDGWGGGGALGRRVGRRRTELELSYRHNSVDVLLGDIPIDNGNLSTTASMANMMFDFLKIGKSNVYAGAGIGIIYGDLHLIPDGGFAIDDTAFAYQGIFGVDRPIGDNVKGFVEYRYLAAEFDFNVEDDFDYDAQNLFFGVEFRR